MKKILCLVVGAIFLTAQGNEALALWEKLTKKQTNLARGICLEYAPVPSYRLTVDQKDRLDLTDGKIVLRKDEKLWFSRDAVGWVDNEILIKADLGSLQALEKAVIRVQAGGARIKLPNRICAFVSKDGEIWYSAAELSRLEPGEKEQHDNLRYFYFDESVPSAVPLVLQLNAEARYVMLKVSTRGFFFADELAVLKGDSKSKNFNAAYARAGEKLPMTGITVRFRTEKLALSDEFFLPQFLFFNDMRTPQMRKEELKLALELPQGVSLHQRDKTWQATKLADGRTRWSTTDLHSLPILLKVAPEFTQDKGAAVLFLGGKEFFRQTVPVEKLTFPKFAPFEKLHVSLAWISEAAQRKWPEFFTVWSRLGFNAVSCFPLHRNGKPYGEEELLFFAKARTQKQKLILNLSPLKEMERRSANKADFGCRGKGKQPSVCPSYFGTEWNKECRRLADYVKELCPDYVFFDIESYPEVMDRSAHCTVCRTEAQKAGLPFCDHIFSTGKRRMKELKEAITSGAKAAGIPVPLIGSYDRSPAKMEYQTERFSDIYPAYIDIAQPSLYVAGRAGDVRRTVRYCAEKIAPRRGLIVFLTAGTYGEFDPVCIENMVLEAFLNGASGITYFKAENFDTPEDFYYHALALKKIRPYEELLANGTLYDGIHTDNPQITVSAMRNGDEILLLLGNYARTTPETKVILPQEISELRDAATNKMCSASGKEFFARIAPGRNALYWILLKK